MSAALMLATIIGLALCIALLGDRITRRHAAADPWSATK